MSETLIPTMRLRFVKRWIPDPKNSMLEMRARVLQQAFTVAETGATIWQVVPLEAEGE